MSDTSVAVRRSNRGVAEDYLVMPSGNGELTAATRFIVADSMLGGAPLKFTDLAFFELGGRWSFGKIELGAGVAVIPKQPPTDSESVWQSASGSARIPINRRTAVSLTGGVGKLIEHDGLWTRQSASLEWKKPIDRDWLSFELSGGVDALELTAPATTSSAMFTEVGVQAEWLFREPTSHWGAWLGVAYAVPVFARGHDPTTNMTIDPQARLDFHAGTVLSIVPEWDIFADFAVIDRGDASMPQTELPILDGGFDQKQLVFGVTRHVIAPPPRQPLVQYE